MPLLSVFASRDELMAAAAERIAASLQAGIDARGQACAALSGGSTPAPAYRLLAGRQLDWSRVTFALVDERFVAPGDPASNEGMLRRALAPALASGAKLIPLYTPDASPQQAAEIAENAYVSLEFDVVLMGMGADAHTASWFPGAAGDALRSQRNVIAVSADGAPGSSERLTLTNAAVSRAREIILLIAGDDKRAALDAAMLKPAHDAPVAALFTNPAHQPEVMWAA
jgi:6-phosphogluconolactonase